MEYKIQDLFEFIRNGANIKQGEPGGYPITRIETISTGEINRNKMGYAGITDIAQFENYLLEHEDILMSHINSEKHLGKSALYEKKESERIIHGMNLLGLRARKEILIPKFAIYSFQTQQFRKSLSKIIKKSVNQASFAVNDLKKIKMDIPSVEQQKYIVSFLDSCNRLLQKRQSQITALDELTKSLFLEMFGDPSSNKNKFGKKQLMEFGEVITGNTPPRKINEYYGNHIEWIKSDNINTPYHFLTKAEEYLSEEGLEKGRMVPNNSILVTCIAGSKSCIGNAAIADREVAFNQQINAIVPNGNPYFLYTQFLVGKSLVQAASTDGMKGLVSKGAFQQIEFICPPIDLQTNFGDKFLKIQGSKEKLLKSLNEIEDLYNSLLSKAFKGELFKEQ